MLRRWIIRSCFMVPILLCLAGWGWSVNHGASYVYPRPPTTYGLATSWGTVSFAILSVPSITGWYCEPKPAHWLPRKQPDLLRSLGFVYRWDRQAFVVDVPYWFLIILFSLLLFFVWRWTRAKVEGRGFEVILKEKV